jgi:hypothetical protein
MRFAARSSRRIYEAQGPSIKAIAREAIDRYIEHGRKDVKSFRVRMNIILKDFGNRIAGDIKPSDIDAWLTGRKCAPASIRQNIQERTRFRKISPFISQLRMSC